MTIEVNGASVEVADDTTVADVLATLAIPAAGIAVALDGELVPRARHADTTVRAGAVVEVLTAVQGG